MKKIFTVFKWFIFSIAVMLALFFMLVLWLIGTPDGPNKNQAIAACQLVIKASLNDPSSAEFVDSLNWPASFEDPIWTIRATYRGSNSFGAIVTETIVCEALDGSYSANLVP